MPKFFSPPEKKLKLTAYIFKYPKEFLLQAAGGIIYDTIVVFGAIFLGRTLDAAGAVYENKAPLSLFYLNLSLFVGITLIFQIARYFKRFYMRIISNSMNCDIRAGLIDNIFGMRLCELSGEKTGDIMSRIIGDVDAVTASVQTTITETWDTVLLMISYFVACMFYSPRLTLLASIPVPIAIFLAETLRGPIYRLSMKSRRAASKINVHLQHNVTGVMLLRLFGLEKTDREQFDVLLCDQYNCQIRSGILQGGAGPIYILVANLGIVLVLGMGGEYVVSGAWTIGTFTAYLAMFTAMATRTNSAAKVMNTWHGAKASWDRIREKLSEKEAAVTGLNPDAVSVDEEGLTVNHLDFTYPHAAEKTLHGISFSAKNGQIIGITGPVGSGKSALAAAISGLYDGVRNPDLAYMDSSHFVFSDDVRFNITLGSDNAGIDEAIDISQLGKDIHEFEKGLDTRLMERGVRISGGQRQRVSLARAWASGCRILILDDPFSAVDVSMEFKIMEKLRENIGNRIILLFSHRLSAFPMTDKIIVLEHGRVTEAGTHAELMESGGIYKNIYSAQVFLSKEPGNDKK